MSASDADSDSVTFIAGDIGGTNSRLQLWQVRPASDDGEPEEVKLAERIYSSQKFASLTFVIDKFLKEVAVELDSAHSYHPIACCLAVAGPVRANKAIITNVNWTLDGAEMARQLDIPSVLIINDFVGIGYGLLALTRDDIVPINDVPLADEAPKACLGAGTGLGEVYLTAGHMLGGDEEDGQGSSSAEYNVWGSEGGHVDFAPRDQLEFGLLEYVKKSERVTRVSVERIVSGLGIPKIYEYFAHLYPAEVSAAVTERLRVEDPGAVIAEYAESGDCNLCRQTIELFVRCYGAEAGNLALKMLPFGGLFIAGGIAPKLMKFMLRGNLFWQHFVQKGRMQALLEKVPVFIVKHSSPGLLGAKVVCRRLMRRQGFLPGRGELASFVEATPRGMPQGLVLPGDDNSFETEVTLRPDGKAPERVVIRRRAQDGAPGATPTPRVSGRTVRWGGGVLVDKSDAFRAGMLGGALAGVLSIASLTALNYLMASRRNVHVSI